MSHNAPTFHNYNLLHPTPRGVFDLSPAEQSGEDMPSAQTGLLEDMAHDLGYEGFDVMLPDNAQERAQITEERIRDFAGYYAPNKVLQENIALTQQRLIAAGKDPLATAVEWAKRSGSMQAMRRSFMSPEIAVPEEFDAGFISGGVARWMKRRQVMTEGVAVKNMHLAGGNRAMGLNEHQAVVEYAKAHNGTRPTEAQFMLQEIAPHVPFEEELTISKVGQGGGAAVAAAGASKMNLDGSVVVFGNAPSAIQSAGEFRAQARKLHPSFDQDGNQLFVVSDEYPIADAGQGPETHQNPYSAAGQFVRNALFLHLNGQNLG